MHQPPTGQQHFLKLGKMKEVFKKRGLKGPEFGRTGFSRLLLEVRISSPLSGDVLKPEGRFCLQSTQTQTFSLVTCLARASRLLRNSITEELPGWAVQ